MAAVCDVEQMFHSFHVSPEHRILHFLWFEENNPSKPIAKFQMTVHLFGNGRSRAVATYGLRKTVKHGEEADVKKFVERNSYVDEGLVSTPTADEVITLVKSTEATLTSANLRLHKLVSSSVSVMEAFCGGGSSERHSQSRALRNAGYWLIGNHGAIAKLISSCILCKKLLGLLLEQKMADVPQTERRLGLPLPASASTCLEHG